MEIYYNIWKNTYFTHVKHMFIKTHVLHRYFTHVFNIRIEHVLNMYKNYTC